MHQKRKPVTYYRIRAEWVWGMSLCMLLLLYVSIYDHCQLRIKSGTDDPAEETQIRTEVTYDEWRSELLQPRQCYLCGNQEKSRITRYQGCDALGLISMNDWSVIIFQLKIYDADGNDITDTGHTGTLYGHTDDLSWLSSGDPSRGMAKISLTFPENARINEDFLRQHLCQSCLDQAAASLTVWKGVEEEKEPIPFCLVDCQTLKLYPLQDWYAGYFIRDYWIDLKTEDNGLSVRAYYLPKTEEKERET